MTGKDEAGTKTRLGEEETWSIGGGSASNKVGREVFMETDAVHDLARVKGRGEKSQCAQWHVHRK